MSKVLEVPDKSVRAMDRYGNDGALKAIFEPSSAKRAHAGRFANQVPVERPVCAYMGQSVCQAPRVCESGTFA